MKISMATTTMMKVSMITVALVATMASAFDENTGKYGDVDTNRAPRLFNPPKQRKAGYTYADEVIIDMDAEMDSMGISLKGNFDAKGDMEMSVTAGSGGSVKIDMVIKNVEADLASPIMNFHCDSNDQTHSDEYCQAFFDTVGAEETLLMDSDGNVLEMTTPDGQTINVAAMEQQTLADKFRANQLAASHHADKMRQFLKLIPDHAVRPGDTWIEDLDMDRIGNFKGESSLKGYTDYQGADCAIFHLEGNLHLEIDLLAAAIGVDPETLPLNKADAHVINKIIWDVDDQIARWLSVNITTSFDIVNPLSMDPSDNSTVHIPAELYFAVATDITKRPDHEEESASSTEPAVYRSPESNEAPKKSGSYEAPNNAAAGGGGAGGAFKGIFFGILVGAAALGGFMLYKKNQESWDFVRPSYEFSPVSAEPIYNSPPLV